VHAHGADKRGRTALHWACESHSPLSAVLCLDQGLDIEAQDSRLQTPLHIACQVGNAQAVQLLIEEVPFLPHFYPIPTPFQRR
jgi:ankyrin repeat protein